MQAHGNRAREAEAEAPFETRRSGTLVSPVTSVTASRLSGQSRRQRQAGKQVESRKVGKALEPMVRNPVPQLAWSWSLGVLTLEFCRDPEPWKAAHGWGLEPEQSKKRRSVRTKIRSRPKEVLRQIKTHL